MHYSFQLGNYTRHHLKAISQNFRVILTCHPFISCSVHLCVTMMHTRDGVAEQFIADVNECAQNIIQHPRATKEGKVTYCRDAESQPK